MTNRIRAFSLIELLVVIAIIGMVAALLFPVFTRARVESHRISCVSNLRQLGQAVSMYVQDDDGQMVPTHQSGEQGRPWYALLTTYIKNDEILKCPADDVKSSKGYERCSYGLNAHLAGVAFPQFQSSSLDPSPKNLATVVRPSATVLMTDSGTIALAGTSPENWPAITPCPAEIGDSAVMSSHPEKGAIQNSALAAPRARHSGRTNVLWVDGHVTTSAISSFFVSPGTIAAGETIAGYSPCLRPEKAASNQPVPGQDFTNKCAGRVQSA